MRHQQITELFDAHAAALVLFARTWCQMPEDAVQAAFIDLSQLDEAPRQPVAWLYTTTKRKALNIVRSEARYCQHTEHAATMTPPWFEAEDAAVEDRNGEIRSALELLTPADREIIVARVWGGLGYEQLAELLGCSVTTAFRQYKCALKKLKKIFESVP